MRGKGEREGLQGELENEGERREDRVIEGVARKGREVCDKDD